MALFKKFNIESKGKRNHDVSTEEIAEVTDFERNPYTEVTILNKHINVVRSIIKIDDERFVSLSDDGSAIVWSVRTGRQLVVIKRNDSRPFLCGLVIADNERGQVFVTSSSDRSLQIWDITSGECVRTLTDNSTCVRCLLSLKSCVLCAAGNNVCLWEIDDGELLAVHKSTNPEDIRGVIAITGGRLVARADNRLYVYSTNVTANKNDNNDSTILSRQLPRKNTVILLKKLMPHREAITSLENISDGFFVSGSIDGTLILWRAYDLLPARYFNSVKQYEGYNKDYPHSVQHILPIDDRYICAAIGHGFGVYDSLSGKTVVEMVNCHHSKVVFMQLVWDNMLLATCSEDGTLRLWGLGSVLDNTSPKHTTSRLFQLLGMGDDDASSWQKEKKPVTLDLIGECGGHMGTVRMLLDYKDAGLVTCGVDSLIILWKNPELESLRRTELLQQILHGVTR